MERRSLQEKSKRQEPLAAPTNRFKSYTASRDESFPAVMITEQMARAERRAPYLYRSNWETSESAADLGRW